MQRKKPTRSPLIFNMAGQLIMLASLTSLTACSSEPDQPKIGSDMSHQEEMSASPDMPVDQAPDQPTPQPLTLNAQEIEVIIDPSALTISWRASSAQDYTVLDRDSLQLGSVSAYSQSVSYDPYGLKVEVSGIKPQLKAWHPLERLKIISQDATQTQLELGFEAGFSATLTLSLKTGTVSATLKPTTSPEGAHIAYYRINPKVSPQEAFYGLGEYFDKVEHRGTIRAMQLEVDSTLESGYNEAHVPIPLIIGTKGWGLFIASDWPGVFDVAKSSQDRVDAIFGAGAKASQGLTFHLLAAPHPLDITKRYYELTGYPKLPARWALGPLVWRDENRDQAQVVDDARIMRELDLAVSGIWIDRPYASAVNSFDFSPAMFDDADAMIAQLHAQGLRVGLWHTPYVDKSATATAALQQEATTQGYFPPTSGPALNGWGTPIDLTNPKARDWWRSLIARYVAQGIEGFKLDYGEDIVPGLLGRRIAWSFDDGSDESTMHTRYQERYHSVYDQALNKPEGAFLLCRGGTWGDQVNGCIIWPGDLDANMLYHGEEGTTREGTKYNAVGGLPASLIAGLSLGPSGYPFYGSDTGGYRHSPVDRETFTRWFQQTALSTVMQIGTSANDVAWEFKPENGFDEEMLGWYRLYTRLHLRLFPYLWTYAKRLTDDGRAIARPLGLAYPELNAHPDDTYMLGDDLLVAPVMRQGQRQRQVMLPPGGWFNWWSGQRVEGGQTITVEAPLKTLPLFIREGALIPMLRPTIDTMSPVEDPEAIDSYATSPGRLWLTIAAGQAGELELFDQATVKLTQEATSLTITTTDGQEFKLGTHLELMGLSDEPQSVTLDGQPLTKQADLTAPDAQGWSFSPGQRAPMQVRLGAGAHTLVITR